MMNNLDQTKMEEMWIQSGRHMYRFMVAIQDYLNNSRDMILEEAAKVCEDHFMSDGHRCAEQIRKMKCQ